MSKNKTATAIPQSSSPTNREREQFMESNFHRMIHQLIALDNIDIPIPESEIQGAMAYTFLQSNTQTLTTEQMQAVCETFSKKACQGECGYTEINFSDFTQRHGTDIFYFSDAAFGFKLSGGNEAISFSFHESCRTNTRVFIGEYSGVTRAFLETKWDDGEYRIAELSEVYLLSTFTVKNINYSLLTIFSSKLEIMNFDVLSATFRDKYPQRTDIPAGTRAPRNRGDYILTHYEEY